MTKIKNSDKHRAVKSIIHASEMMHRRLETYPETYKDRESDIIRNYEISIRSRKRK